MSDVVEVSALRKSYGAHEAVSGGGLRHPARHQARVAAAAPEQVAGRFTAAQSLAAMRAR